MWKEGDGFCRADGTPLVRAGGPEDPLSGFDLMGRYRLVELLGAGGMGFVYLATQTGLGREVAIKMLYAERTRDAASLKRFRREARALASLDHPGCVRVIDYGETSHGMPYLAMERVHGRPLDEVIDPERGIAAHLAIHVAADICDAIGAAHQRGIVHRDLKPSNVLLEKRPEGLRIHLVDFGLAMVDAELSSEDSADHRLTRAGLVAGTPEYMSPEQVQGLPAEPRSDLYALGIVLFEMLTGTVPFVGDTPGEVLSKHLQAVAPRIELGAIAPDAHDVLAALIGSLLAKEPSERPASAAVVATRLRAIALMLPKPSDPSTLVDLPAQRPSEARTHQVLAPDDATIEQAPSFTVETSPPSMRWESFETTAVVERRLPAPGRPKDGGPSRPIRVALILVTALALVASAALFTVTYRGLRAPSMQATPLAMPPPAPPVAAPPDPALDLSATAAATAQPRPAGSDLMPGGDSQASYEAALRALQEGLRARGLRTRDLRVEPSLRALWTAQESAGRARNFDRARQALAEFAEATASLEARPLMQRRLDMLEARATRPLDVAAARALRQTLVGASGSPAGVRAFMQRLDELEQRLSP